MEDIIKKINTHTRGCRVDESLNALIKQALKDKDKISKNPKGYFFVTELTNPIQAYYDRKTKEVKKSIELERKLKLGNQLQRIARMWVSKLPDFDLEEGKIDGAYVDVAGVRGSIDFRVGDAILELKTKETTPTNEQEIIDKYPNDLEQLTFYSALHPSYPKENFLVFMRDTEPHQIATFKVTIKNHNNIKNIIRARIKLLTEALETNNPSKLGQCRYLNKRCPYQENKICDCSNTSKISADNILRNIQINPDTELTENLNQIKDNPSDKKEAYYHNDILIPKESTFQAKKTDTYKEYEILLDSIIKELRPLHLNEQERKETRESRLDERFQSAFKWIKLKSSTQTSELIVPYIARVSSTDRKEYTNRPHQYHIARLGIIASNHNKSKGIIFIIYPKLNHQIQTFEVTYDNKKIHDFLKKRINSLNKDTKS